MAKVLEQYVKDNNGEIFHVVKHNKYAYKCYLRSRNNYREVNLIWVKQQIVSGGWSAINEGEWKKWVKKDNEYINKLSHKLVKRVIMAQLLLEINDDLAEDHEDNKYLKNVLNKSNKECERIVKRNYEKLYSSDESLLQNVLNKIENLTKNLSQMNIEQFVDVDALVQSYIKNPEKYQSKTIEMTKIK